MDLDAVRRLSSVILFRGGCIVRRSQDYGRCEQHLCSKRRRASLGRRRTPVRFVIGQITSDVRHTWCTSRSLIRWVIEPLNLAGEAPSLRLPRRLSSTWSSRTRSPPTQEKAALSEARMLPKMGSVRSDGVSLPMRDTRGQFTTRVRPCSLGRNTNAFDRFDGGMLLAAQLEPRPATPCRQSVV
jgi:hypothetical protein